MSDFRIDQITNRVGDAGTQIWGVSTFNGTSGMQLPVGPTEYRGGRGRGIFAGGYEVPAVTSEIQTIEIATLGNGTRFGDLSNFVSSPISSSVFIIDILAQLSTPLTNSPFIFISIPVAYPFDKLFAKYCTRTLSTL